MRGSKTATGITAEDGPDFDLDLETVASAVSGPLLNGTVDSCGSARQSACSISTCIGGRTAPRVLYRPCRIPHHPDRQETQRCITQ